MKISIALFVIVAFFLFSATSYAAELAGEKKNVWDKLNAKLATYTPQRNVYANNEIPGSHGTGIGANDLYWKGETKPNLLDAEELSAFKHAVDFAAAGQAEPAQAAFSEFNKAYPESVLRKDAELALESLSKK